MRTELAEGSIHAQGRRSLAYWNQEFQRIHSPVLRYGFAVVSIALALGLSLALQHYAFYDLQLPVFTLAIGLTTWYAGTGPSVLAIFTSSLVFDYSFTEPLYSFAISGHEFLYYLIFVLWGIIVASFSAVRRQMEARLRQALENLQVEVEQRRHREDEIRKLNQELVRRAVELEAANKELESFTYSVSHDLRAPLRHVVGYSELLQRQASALLDEKSQRFIRTIFDSAKRMGDLIDDLLAFPGSGAPRPKRRR